MCIYAYTYIWYRSNVTSHLHNTFHDSIGLLKRSTFVTLEKITRIANDWGEPEQALHQRVSLDHHFTSLNNKKHNMIPYKFLCDMKVFCSIPDLPYKVVGSSLLWKKYATKFF